MGNTESKPKISVSFYDDPQEPAFEIIKTMTLRTPEETINVDFYIDGNCIYFATEKHVPEVIEGLQGRYPNHHILISDRPYDDERYQFINRYTSDAVGDVYFTLDNRDYPYKVVTDYESLRVYLSTNQYGGGPYYQTKPALTISNDEITEIHVGSSYSCRMSKFGGNDDEPLPGNTLLIHLSGLDYISIGNAGIIKFEALNTITTYHSPVGNNMVPYPYALDSSGNVYLFASGVEIVLAQDLPERTVSFKNYDVYDDFYEGKFSAIPPKKSKLLVERIVNISKNKYKAILKKYDD